ncbi:hypothetical protein [Terracoccus sp. 273MFTsu3.1]|uniref:hypothetical protein n=1 Tax=Terracoccus sp. 273MFTsu3.1 TaxID=1172188 RepID=UPI000365B3B6|nr:hypothetical protein [Terracoccus sp. 273MFTsu3.1]
MQRPTEDPTTDADGWEHHPAFGSITAHRISTTPGAVLFDSEIRHTYFVRVTISPMQRKRDLNRDWLHTGNRPLMEVDMSEAQWASFVSSMNTSGVPCTIRTKENDHNIPNLPFDARLALSAKETQDAAQHAFEGIKEAMDALEALPSNAGVKARREAMRRLHFAIENAPKNVEFAAKSLTEHTENVVQKARADIEAMVVSRAQALGVEPSQIVREITAGGEDA